MIQLLNFFDKKNVQTGVFSKKSKEIEVISDIVDGKITFDKASKAKRAKKEKEAEPTEETAAN